jgi:hypothetical protein
MLYFQCICVYSKQRDFEVSQQQVPTTDSSRHWDPSSSLLWGSELVQLPLQSLHCFHAADIDSSSSSSTRKGWSRLQQGGGPYVG